MGIKQSGIMPTPIRFLPKTKSKLREIAAQHRRSVSSLVNILVEAALDRGDYHEPTKSMHQYKE